MLAAMASAGMSPPVPNRHAVDHLHLRNRLPTQAPMTITAAPGQTAPWIEFRTLGAVTTQRLAYIDVTQSGANAGAMTINCAGGGGTGGFTLLSGNGNLSILCGNTSPSAIFGQANGGRIGIGDSNTGFGSWFQYLNSSGHVILSHDGTRVWVGRVQRSGGDTGSPDGTSTGTIQGVSSYGTNVAGCPLHLRGGAGSGSGAPGKLILQGSTVLGSGTTVQTHTDVLTITDAATITLADAVNVVLNATTGTKWGTATTQKQAWFNATPVVQQATIVDADGTLADITTKFNSLLAKLETYGLLASA